MQHTNVKKLFVQVFACALFLFLVAFSGTARAGLDSYEIYLNNKLILRQTVDKPLSLESLQLDKSNVNDQLIIHYSQCNAPNKLGKGRSITIKDASGNKVREWKFADAQGSHTGMVIQVKELLQLERNNAGTSLTLIYTAEGHPEGQKLTSLHIGSKNTTYIHKNKEDFLSFVATKFVRA